MKKVRRLAEAAGLSVTALKRVRVGGLRLPRDLSIGEYRSLSPHEIRRAVAPLLIFLLLGSRLLIILCFHLCFSTLLCMKIVPAFM